MALYKDDESTLRQLVDEREDSKTIPLRTALQFCVGVGRRFWMSSEQRRRAIEALEARAPSPRQ